MKTLEEISYLHTIEQLREEVRKLTDENKLLRKSIKRYLHEEKKMKSLVVVIVFHSITKVFTEKAFAATKKKVQIVGIGVISINTDNYGNRRKSNK